MPRSPGVVAGAVTGAAVVLVLVGAMAGNVHALVVAGSSFACGFWSFIVVAAIIQAADMATRKSAP